MATYNKLVRDKIPEHIRLMNEPFESHVATPDEFKEKLYEKLQEEAAEFANDSTKEELADILEVIEAIKKLNGWTTEEVEHMRLEKLQKRGGFDQRIILGES